jgi:hypothetical protein
MTFKTIGMEEFEQQNETMAEMAEEAIWNYLEPSVSNDVTGDDHCDTSHYLFIKKNVDISADCDRDVIIQSLQQYNEEVRMFWTVHLFDSEESRDAFMDVELKKRTAGKSMGKDQIVGQLDVDTAVFDSNSTDDKGSGKKRKRSDSLTISTPVNEPTETTDCSHTYDS